MNIDVSGSTLSLQRDRMITLREATGARVECLDGALWITQEGEAQDTVLSPGGTFTVGHTGLTLVLALRPSQLRVCSSRAPAVRAVERLHALFSPALRAA